MRRAGVITQVPITEGIIQKETLPSTIKRPKVSSEKIYVLTDPWMIYNLLIKYKEQIDDPTVVCGLIEFVEFFISDGIPKQVQNREDTIKALVNACMGFFFPPSFCS